MCHGCSLQKTKKKKKDRLPEPTATSRHVPWHNPVHHRAKTQLHPPAGAPPPESMHKHLGKPHQLRGRQQKQENYDPVAWVTKSTNTDQNLHWNQLVPGPWVMRGECTAGTHRKFLQGQKTELTYHTHSSSNLDKMKQQRSMFQMKEQDKIPEELSDMELGNLFEK